MTSSAIFSAQDIFYLVLSGSLIIVVILFAILLLQIIFVIRDFKKISQNAHEVTDQLKNFIIKPVNYTSKLAVNFMPHIESFIKSKFSKKAKDTKSKK